MGGFFNDGKNVRVAVNFAPLTCTDEALAASQLTAQEPYGMEICGKLSKGDESKPTDADGKEGNDNDNCTDDKNKEYQSSKDASNNAVEPEKDGDSDKGGGNAQDGDDKGDEEEEDNDYKDNDEEYEGEESDGEEADGNEDGDAESEDEDEDDEEGEDEEVQPPKKRKTD